MKPLASVNDVLFRLPDYDSFDQSNQQRLLTMLTDASAVVRRYTRQSFTMEQTTERMPSVGNKVKLVKSPVVSVDDVKVFVNNQLYPAPAWIWSGLDELWLAGPGDVVNAAEIVNDFLAYSNPVAQVTYTHGYLEVPDDIVAVTAGLVARGMTTPSLGGIDRESAGDYSYGLSRTSALGPLALNDSDKEILKPYRRGGFSMQLRG